MLGLGRAIGARLCRMFCRMFFAVTGTMRIVMSLEQLMRKLQARVRIANAGQVERARFDVQLAEHGICSNIVLQLGNLGAGVLQIAEHDGLCRAGGLASRLNSFMVWILRWPKSKKTCLRQQRLLLPMPKAR